MPKASANTLKPAPSPAAVNAETPAMQPTTKLSIIWLQKTSKRVGGFSVDDALELLILSILKRYLRQGDI